MSSLAPRSVIAVAAAVVVAAAAGPAWAPIGPHWGAAHRAIVTPPPKHHRRHETLQVQRTFNPIHQTSASAGSTDSWSTGAGKPHHHHHHH